LAESDAAIDESLTELRSAIDRSAHFTYPWEPVLVPMEQFFADVYFEVATTHDEMHLAVYRALLRLYIRVLAETTNWMLLHKSAGGLDRLVRQELRRAAGDKLTIVTFNQDLVLESVAARISRQWGRWCLRAFYGDPPLTELVARPSKTPTFPLHSASCLHQPPFKLLKLHGSINWATKSRDREMKRSRLFPGPVAAVHVLNGRLIPLQRERVLRASGPGRRPWYLSSLVVPPIYDKQQVTGTSVLQHLWQDARESISSADRLVLVGYSLPDSDVGGKQMLRRAFGENAQPDCVECVNPDAAMAAKLKDVLGARVVRLYDSVETYLRHAGDPA
jgi:hypothetical protein